MDHFARSAWTVRLIAEFDAADQEARRLLTGLSQEQLNWQPGPSAWSVGQCLEHLCLMNEAYLPAISTALEGKPTPATPEITLGWFSRWFINNYVEPSVLDRFLRSNETARQLVRCSGDYDVNSIRYKNPFIPLLRFTVRTGLQIVSRHQRRHLLQAGRVKSSPESPAQSSYAGAAAV